MKLTFPEGCTESSLLSCGSRGCCQGHGCSVEGQVSFLCGGLESFLKNLLRPALLLRCGLEWVVPVCLRRGLGLLPD